MTRQQRGDLQHLLHPPGPCLRSIVRSSSSKFLSFCREGLEIPHIVIEKAKRHAPLGEDVKSFHINEAYRKGRLTFLRKHPDLPMLRNMQPNMSPPDSLPAEDIYFIIDDQESTGKSWLRYAQMYLGVTNTDADALLSNKVLTEEQKYSLLEFWIKEQGSSEDAMERLCKLYVEYGGRRAF